MTPLSVVSWKRAMVLSMTDGKERIQVIDYYPNQHIEGTNGKKYPVPCVAVKTQYVSNRQQKVKFSRKNVFVRDKLTCLYCGFCNGGAENLTIDHVIPRATWSKKAYPGTPTNWTNIVTCCKSCNYRKADKTPNEAGMKLLKQPFQPHPYSFVPGISIWHKQPDNWIPYLPPLYKEILIKRERL